MATAEIGPILLNIETASLRGCGAAKLEHDPETPQTFRTNDAL